MGTHANITVKNNAQQQTFFSHYDGYPEEHGIVFNMVLNYTNQYKNYFGGVSPSFKNKMIAFLSSEKAMQLEVLPAEIANIAVEYEYFIDLDNETITIQSEENINSANGTYSFIEYLNSYSLIEVFLFDGKTISKSALLLIIEDLEKEKQQLIEKSSSDNPNVKKAQNKIEQIKEVLAN